MYFLLPLLSERWWVDAPLRVEEKVMLQAAERKSVVTVMMDSCVASGDTNKRSAFDTVSIKIAWTFVRVCLLCLLCLRVRAVVHLSPAPKTMGVDSMHLVFPPDAGTLTLSRN